MFQSQNIPIANSHITKHPYYKMSQSQNLPIATSQSLNVPDDKISHHETFNPVLKCPIQNQNCLFSLTVWSNSAESTNIVLISALLSLSWVMLGHSLATFNCFLANFLSMGRFTMGPLVARDFFIGAFRYEIFHFMGHFFCEFVFLIGWHF